MSKTRHTMSLATSALVALGALSACGGGGDSETGAFAVTATRNTGGVSTIYTVCVQGIAYYDPATTQGQAITRTLMSYYGLSGASQSLSNSAKTCRELVPGVDTIVSIDEYNRVVVPGASTIGSGGSGNGTGGTNTGLSFITWTGNGNGVVVVDADNERFAFTTTTRCMYSYNRQEVTPNYCLDASPAATGSLATVRFQVLSIRSTTGGCIAGLADLAGNQIDIFTDSSGRQVARVTTTRWDTSGCTR